MIGCLPMNALVAHEEQSGRPTHALKWDASNSGLLAMRSKS